MSKENQPKAEMTPSNPMRPEGTLYAMMDCILTKPWNRKVKAGEFIEPGDSHYAGASASACFIERRI